MRITSLGGVSTPVARIAGKVATAGFLTAILFQLLLALGIMPVTMAWGGSQPVLTPSLRVASVFAAIVLALFAYVIRQRAGLGTTARPSKAIKILAWVITLYLGLNTLGNFASPSTAEAMLFGTLSMLSALASLLVSASRADP